jgi:hypothetical protein
MPQISIQEFERLPLRVHDFLAGVPPHDVWAEFFRYRDEVYRQRLRGIVSCGPDQSCKLQSAGLRNIRNMSFVEPTL